MTTDPGTIESFAERVIAENPTHGGFLRASLAAMAPATRAALAEYIAFATSRIPLDELVDCYNTIVADTQFEQIHFHRHGRYRWSKFSEVAEHVYFDAAYMKKYMYGLALTSFLWPNHAALHDFFVRTFPPGRRGTYLEIGPGHGYYFMKAAQLGAFDRLVGVDISAASVALTRDILQFFGVDKAAPVEVVEGDFLAFSPGAAEYSCIVMGEVLEHVEDPGRFLRKIAELAAPDTHIFVTTCANAPAVDHIYLFSSVGEADALVELSGLAIAERHYEPYAGRTLAECEERKLSINIAYVLRKA